MKLFDKLKKIPLPAVALGLMGFMLLVAIAAVMLPSEKAKTKISQVQAKKDTSQPMTPFPSAQEAEQKEKELLEKQKRYLGGVSIQKETPPPPPKETLEPKTQKEQEIIDKKVKEVVDKTSQRSGQQQGYSMSTIEPPGQPQFTSLYASQQEQQLDEKAKLFQYFLTQGQLPVGKRQGSNTATAKAEPEKEESTNTLPQGIIPGKLYMASLTNTISSIKQKQKVYAEIKDPPLRGAKLSGTSDYAELNDRINVVFDTLIYEGKQYKVKATAYSLDKVEGVASHVKYHSLAKIQALGATAFTQAMLDALREDETTTTSTFWGTQTTTQKSQNRLREGLLAGGSAAFSEIKNVMSQSLSKYPDIEIIAEKGTPFYVVFEE